MKKLNCIGSLVLLSAATVAQAQRGTLAFPHPPLPEPLPPVPVVWEDANFQPPPWSAQRAATPATGTVAIYDQKPAGGRDSLIPTEQAKGIIDRFKTVYPKLGSPRLLLSVNREFVDGQPVVSRADRTIVRDVERRFGRPWRQAGTTLVEQKTAAALVTNKPLSEFIGTADTVEAKKNHEAINAIAEVVIEVLISSKPQTATTIPEMQATAIRLSDSKILGQAAAADVVKRVSPRSLAGVGVEEMAEAVALELMEDLAANP